MKSPLETNLDALNYNLFSPENYIIERCFCESRVCVRVYIDQGFECVQVERVEFRLHEEAKIKINACCDDHHNALVVLLLVGTLVRVPSHDRDAFFIVK